MDDDLVAMTAKLKGEFQSDGEKREELMRCCEKWVQRREEAHECWDEARRAEDAASEAEFAFQVCLAQYLDKKEVMEEKAMWWRRRCGKPSKSNLTNKQNLENVRLWAGKKQSDEFGGR